MKLLLENGSYQLLNFGDIAMLQAAIRRLRQRLPGVQLHAVTYDPERLAFFCPGVKPVPPYGKSGWRPTTKLSQQPEASSPARWPARLKDSAKGLARDLLRQGRRLSILQFGLPRGADSDRYLETLARCDGLVVSGGGYLTDAWEPHFLQLLDCEDFAKRHGKRVLLFGQGYGPATKPLLEAAARRVLPHVDRIGVREGCFTPRWLRRWGVRPEQFTVTGDDAIELAHEQRPAGLGELLGLNVRAASYSGVREPQLAELRAALLPLAEEVKTDWQPFPISGVPAHPDLAAIARLFGSQAVPNAPASDPLELRVEDIIRRVGQCRVVVTGSYHGGVFALSQGIPAVCLVRSRYYAQKFLGLASQFGTGAEVVMLDEGDLASRLRRAVTHLWHHADEIRPSLLRAAERQIAATNQFYDAALVRTVAVARAA